MEELLWLWKVKGHPGKRKMRKNPSSEDLHGFSLLSQRWEMILSHNIKKNSKEKRMIVTLINNKQMRALSTMILQNSKAFAWQPH